MKKGLILLFGSVLLVLSSCGRFCIGPFGPVEDCYTTPNGDPQSSGPLRIEIQKIGYVAGQVFTAGEVVPLWALGGAAGNYQWDAFPVGGSEAGALSATIGGTVTLTLPSATNTTTRVRVRDASNNIFEVQLGT